MFRRCNHPIDQPFKKKRELPLSGCDHAAFTAVNSKVPVKPIQRVKIAYSVLQSVSNLFHVIHNFAE